MMLWTRSTGWGDKKTEIDWTCPLDWREKESYNILVRDLSEKTAWKKKEEMKGFKWCLEK